MTLPEPLEGPGFSTYDRDDVRWLLTDVSGRVAETTGIDRERKLQSGAHYSESLPVEYVPSDGYEALVRAAIASQALPVAEALARLCDGVLRERPAPVLVSLARAGTPAGILMRRWMRFRHGIDAPHYTMSIILDRGLDRTAIEYLVANHDPESILFVDGWTGKGSISRELEASIAGLGSLTARISPALAVLADPAATAAFAGTRSDILIPSAMLNSTVSGLVSRTVYAADLIPEGAFHGAQYYSELIDRDLSSAVIDAVASRFGDVGSDLAAGGDPERSPARVAGKLDRIAREHAVARPGFIKPGICETTRVLLRRVPRAIIVAERGDPQVAHLEYLAAEREVPILEDPELMFRAVGLISSLAS